LFARTYFSRAREAQECVRTGTAGAVDCAEHACALIARREPHTPWKVVMVIRLTPRCHTSCPLWVKSRHMRRNKSCPLYSQLPPPHPTFALPHLPLTPTPRHL